MENIVIVTAGNNLFIDSLKECIASYEKFGYKVQAYDLENTGIGKKFIMPDWITTDQQARMNSHGYNLALIEGERFSRSLWKGPVIEQARKDLPDKILIWADGDTRCMKSLGDISGNYDIGVAIRSEKEMLKIRMNIDQGASAFNKYMGKHNAGFIVFQPTYAADEFIKAWIGWTIAVKNDQGALNIAVDDKAVVVKKFPNVYNSEELRDDTVIYHMKGKKKTKTV